MEAENTIEILWSMTKSPLGLLRAMARLDDGRK
jgi:hypothetical protein